MADKEISTKLSSGEITQIKINGTASTQIVRTAGENDALYSTITTSNAIDARVTELEDTHRLLITATSLAASQLPTVVDVPIKVEFGAAQVTTDIDVSITGDFTFKTAGRYIISTFFQYGRTGATGTSILLNRYLVNGTQVGSSLCAQVDNPNILVPWAGTIQFTASVNDVLTIELMRDSTGNNSGGLYAFNPTLAGWDDAPCASIQIYKAV